MTSPTNFRPGHILLLNAVAGCAGYFVLGQKKKGIAVAIPVVLLAIPTCGTLSLPFILAAMIDGYLQAQEREAGHQIGEWTFFDQHLDAESQSQ